MLNFQVLCVLKLLIFDILQFESKSWFLKCLSVFWSIAVIAEKNADESLPCGGWGRRVDNFTEYRQIKHTCYLAMRKGELCCIDKPVCPEGLRPEIPIKPYHLYPLQKLSLGCVKPKDERKKFRKEKMENKMLCEDSTMDDICCYADFFNLFTITCLCIRNIKENYSSSGIVHNLVLYFGLIIMYELLVILFENALYFLWNFDTIDLYLLFLFIKMIVCVELFVWNFWK